MNERNDTMQNGLTNHIPSRSTIAVVGLGKIGLPLAVQFARHEQSVIGCDINPVVVEQVNAGQSYINEEPELAAGVADAVRKGLRSDTLVIYETTLPIGTTTNRFAQILECTSKLKAGHDFFLAYSPERVKSGRIFRDLRTYPKVVGGIDERSTDAAVEFYRSVLDAEVIAMASTDEAEFVKLIET